MSDNDAVGIDSEVRTSVGESVGSDVVGAEERKSALETAASVLRREAQLYGRVGDAETRAVFKAFEKALKNPDRVKAFIGSSA